MKNIDIEEIAGLKEYLKELKGDDVSYILENGEARYAILPIGEFDYLESFKDLEENEMPSGVKIITNMPELSYDEYENIKKQLMDVLEKNFKPKPEKLN